MTNSVLTKHVQLLIQSLVNQDVNHFVVSPGSRSTPIALLLAEYVTHLNSDVAVHMAVDERDAAFLALGLAKDQQMPVALLATSGTATANYLPAISEARLSHVPLIVLTTDRPQELRHVGAPQTIQQVDLYGEHVKRALELTLQDNHADVAAYISYATQHLVRDAVVQPAGPVQINLPLRKPLMPDLDTAWPTVDQQVFLSAINHVDVTALKELLTDKKVALFVGPQEETWSVEKFADLATYWQVPIIADVLSNVRGQALAIAGIDVLLSVDAISTEAVPDVIIRFGGTPVSGRVLPWMKDHNVLEIQVGVQHISHDHSRHTMINIASSADEALEALRAIDLPTNAEFLSEWQKTQVMLSDVQQSDAADGLTEMSVAKALTNISDKEQMLLANSMVIRDFDNYWQPKVSVKMMANRGANGIDGTVASAVGMAMNGHKTWLPIGDLTLFHDMNGLMLARQKNVDLTLVVTNNNGGGIFSFLPQSQADAYFDEMFGTPQNLDIEKIADLYDAEYHLIASEDDLQSLIKSTWRGLRILELRTDRHENVEAHSQRVEALKEAAHG